MGQLSNVAEILWLNLLKFQYLHKDWWVSSKIDYNYKAVLTCLENVRNEKKNYVPTVKGVVTKFKNFTSVLTLHFVLDFLLISKKLSLIFQKEQILNNF